MCGPDFLTIHPNPIQDISPKSNKCEPYEGARVKTLRITRDSRIRPLYNGAENVCHS